MDQKKKKTLNIPENKGLIHNFKFDIEVPFAPIAFPKTLYYQLDQERHTRPKVLNADVKGMCNLFVNCDLGLPIDDLNMKPHIYNLQEGSDYNQNHTENNGNTKDLHNQLHPDDLALINEDIIVSDTEEDEETLKTQKEQKLLDQRIKEEQQKILMKQQMLQKQSELAKDKDTDFSQGFEQVKLAIEHTFVASNNIKLEEIKHPSDPNRSIKRVFNLLPNLANQSLKLGVVSYKQKVESLTNSLQKGRFCTLFKDISFEDKNQNLFRLFVQKLQDEEPYRPKKIFEEDMIDVDSQYNELFEEDQEVILEEQDDEILNHNQIKLKNKSVFSYSDHSTKLQPNDYLLLFSKQTQSDQIQNAYFQKVQFQISLDQEKKELANPDNQRQSIELGRYVKMDIIDEEQIRLMKQIDQDIVDEEFGGDQQQDTKKKSLKQKNRNQNFDEDDEEDDGDFMEEELEDEDEELQDIDDDENDGANKKSSVNKEQPARSYNLRESRKQNNVFNQLSAEKKNSNVVATQEEEQDVEEHLDNIFSDSDQKDNNNNNNNVASAQNISQNQNNQVIEEEEDDDEFQFGASRQKANSEDKDNQWAKDSKYKKSKNNEDDDFINDEDEEEVEEEMEDVSSVSDHKDQDNELQKYFENKQQQAQPEQKNIGQIEEMSDDEDDDEFPL